MTAENQNIEKHVEGDSLVVEVPVRDRAGDPLPLGGASIEWVLADERGGEVLVSKSTTGGGVTVTDSAGGVFEVTLQAVETEGLYNDQDSIYHHEAEVTDINGIVHTVTTGKVAILEETT